MLDVSQRAGDLDDDRIAPSVRETTALADDSIVRPVSGDGADGVADLGIYFE